jgi:hypothetical protein
MIAVQAYDKDQAFETVQAELSSEVHIASEWSDWHVVGGGRWNSNGNQYNDDNSDVISYDEEPEKFLEAITQVRGWRKEAMEWYLKQFNASEIQTSAEQFVENNGVNVKEFDSSYFAAVRMGELLSGFYNSESHFYDLHLHTADIRYVLKDPRGYYLVAVDYHH